MEWRFGVCWDGDLRFSGVRIWGSLWWRFVFRWDSGGLVLGGICEYMCQHAPISGDMSYYNLKYLQINWGGGKGVFQWSGCGKRFLFRKAIGGGARILWRENRNREGPTCFVKNSGVISHVPWCLGVICLDFQRCRTWWTLRAI